MAVPIFIGHDDVLERNLYVVHYTGWEEIPAEISLPGAQYAVLLAGDAAAVSNAEIGRVARALLNGGAVYVCAWGPDCERVHDIIDEESINPDTSNAEGVLPRFCGHFR